MEHTNVLMGYDMNSVSVDISDLDEVRLKRKYPRVGEREALRLPFPINSPIGSRSPTIAVDEEGEFGVIEKKFAIKSFNVNWSDTFFPCNEI